MLKKNENYDLNIKSMEIPIIVTLIDGESYICDITSVNKKNKNFFKILFFIQTSEEQTKIKINSKAYGSVCSLEIFENIGCIAIGYEIGRYEFWSLISLQKEPLFCGKQQKNNSIIGFAQVISQKTQSGYIWICSESKTPSASLHRYEMNLKVENDSKVKKKNLNLSSLQIHELKLSAEVYAHYFDSNTIIVDVKSIKHCSDKNPPNKCIFITESTKKNKKFHLQLFDLDRYEYFNDSKGFKNSFFTYPLDGILTSDSISVKKKKKIFLIIIFFLKECLFR